MPEEKEASIWRRIIGSKIICSKCKERGAYAFKFGSWRPGSGPANVWITCKTCGHNGDYHPTQEEVHIYETLVKHEIEKQVTDQYGEDPPISNIEVESIYRTIGKIGVVK